MEEPPAKPDCVSTGTPNAPETVCCRTVEPVSVATALTSVFAPAFSATNCIEPSELSTPSPPWTAYGAGNAPKAGATTARAARATSSRVDRRTMAPP